MSGLTDGEAKEFHGIFVISFLIFTAIAVVAHTYSYGSGVPGYQDRKAMLFFSTQSMG